MLNELHATLAISKSEALTGTSRTLTLPGGRQVTVNVPPGAYDGQVIRLHNPGEPYGSGGATSALILTLAVQQAENPAFAADAESAQHTILASNPSIANPSWQQPTPMPDSHLQPDQFSNRNFQQQVIPPPPPNQSVAPFPPASPNSPRPRSGRGRIVLLIVLVLLIILGSAGLYAIIHANQVASTTASTDATATTVASLATGTASARSATATAVASHATATAQARAQATASTIAANPDPYGGGTLALLDPLRDNSQGHNWDEGSGCAFTGGAYHAIEANLKFFVSCYARATNYTNFAYEVQMTILKGDVGGILFRANNASSTFYLFYVSAAGDYEVLLCPGSTCRTILTTTSSAAIKQGQNVTNTVAVVAQGNTITLYVNQQRLSSLTDNTFSHGQIGVAASPFANNGHPTEVAYSNARVWTL